MPAPTLTANGGAAAPAYPPLDEVRRTLRVMEAAQEAARGQRTVALPQP